MIPAEAYSLTTEQELQLEVLRRTVGAAPREVLEERLLEAFDLVMRKENVCRALVTKLAKGDRP